MTPFNENVFRKYDIRGRAESDLHDDFVLALGRAYGTVIEQAVQPLPWDEIAG